MKDKQLVLRIKVGEGGRTFGSISAKEIAEAAKAQLGYELDKKKMHFNPIKELGTTMVPIKLHPQVTGEHEGCSRRKIRGILPWKKN